MVAIIFIAIIIGYFLIKAVLTVVATPIALTGYAVYSNTRKGLEESYEKMRHDDYVQLLCDVIYKAGYGFVQREEFDANVISGEKNRVKKIWYCPYGEVTADSVNFLLRRIERCNAAEGILCYKGRITEGARKYAFSKNIRVLSPYDIADTVVSLKHNSYSGRLPIEGRLDTRSKKDYETVENLRFNYPKEESQSTIIEGTGNSSFRIEPLSGWMLYIKGNSEGARFTVEGLDSNRKRTELFVDTSEPFEGFGFDFKQKTRIIKVKATGTWQIEMRSVYTADILSLNTAYHGTGCRLLMLPALVNEAEIEGNEKQVYFGVRSFTKKAFAFEEIELLVNECDKFAGTVKVEKNPRLLFVEAEGDWTITVR